MSSIPLMPLQIPEYCRVLEESEISEHCFDLIFAFDEIVALGYRENVNLAQIRTFTEMDSHEEKVFRAVREVSSSKRFFSGWVYTPVFLVPNMTTVFLWAIANDKYSAPCYSWRMNYADPLQCLTFRHKYIHTMSFDMI